MISSPTFSRPATSARPGRPSPPASPTVLTFTPCVKNPRARFRAGIEQALALGIFTHGVNVRTVGEAGGDGRPGLAEVAGLENVGLEIIELVSVDGGVGGAGFER